MNTDKDSLTGIFNSVIHRAMRYAVPREGRVVDIEDPAGKGRVKAVIPSLNWDTNDKAVWCYPKDKNSLTTVEVGAWIIIEFVNMDPSFPIYLGESARIAEQLPKNYRGPGDHVIFEDPENTIRIKYNGDTLEIGNSNFLDAARVDDTVEVTIPANSFLIAADAGVMNPAPVKVQGVITSGSDQVKVGDK